MIVTSQKFTNYHIFYRKVKSLPQRYIQTFIGTFLGTSPEFFICDKQKGVSFMQSGGNEAGCCSYAFRLIFVNLYDNILIHKINS